jgi:uncharacterized delta-60 repeat protein
VAVGAATLALLALTAGAASAAPAALDKTFGHDGWIAIDSGGDETANGVAIQPDGKIVVAGGTTGTGDAAVYRLKADGSLDGSFDGDGTVAIDGGGSETATAVALQADGKIVVVGATDVNDDAVVSRLNPNGSPDKTFDGDGRVAIDGGAVESASAVAIQADGKIVVAGSTTVRANATVYRLNPNGSPDATFDGDGARVLNARGEDHAEAVAIQPDGGIVVAGSTTNGYDAVVWRLTPSGSFDPSFDRDGALTLDEGGAETASAIALQPDGKIVLAGASSIGGDALVYRLTPSGARDGSFGTDGAAALDSGGWNVGHAVTVQPNGKIVVGATSEDVEGNHGVIYRLRSDGSRDRRFGLNGAVTPEAGGFDEVLALGLGADGRIVVGGHAHGATQDALVLRLKGDGARA